MLKKLFSHTLIYGLSPQIVLVVNFFLLPFITQELNETDYGVYATILTYSTAFSIFSNLGMSANISNSFYKSPMQYKWAWRQYYGFLNIWNIVFGIFLATVIYFVIPDEAVEHRWTIVLLNTFPYVIMGQTALFGRKYYQFTQQPAQIAIRSLIFGLLTAILNYVFIVKYKMGYMGWFWATFISTILSNVSYWYALNYLLKLSPIFKFKRRLIRNSLKIALPTIPHFYSGYLLNSSQILVMDNLNVSTANIGKYQAANTFGVLADGAATAVGWAIGPIQNQKYKENKHREARDIIFLVQIAFFTATFIVAIWLKELFALMINNDVLNKMYYLGIILIMSINYRPMYFGIVNKIIFYEKTNMLWKLTLVAGLLNVIGNFICIPIWGYESAAIVAFIAFNYMGYAGFYYKVYNKIETENYYPLFWLFGSILLCAIAYWIVEWDWKIKIIITVICLAISTFSILKMNKKITI